MGASESRVMQVNKILSETGIDSSCDCTAKSSNTRGDTNVVSRGCGLIDLDLSQTSRADCDCKSEAAFDKLAKLVTTADPEVESAMSFTSSSSDVETHNETSVKSYLDMTCGSLADAKNEAGDFNVHQDCSTMTAEEKEIRVNASQASSAQAACLLSLAAKVDMRMKSDTNPKTTTKNPASAIIDSAGDAIGSVMGSLFDVNKAAVAACMVAVVLVVVVVFKMKQTGKSDAYENDGYADDRYDRRDDYSGDGKGDYGRDSSYRAIHRAETSLLQPRVVRQVVHALLRGN